MKDPTSHESYPDPHHDTYSNTVFGFWVYLLTDFMLFGALFATYAVLKNNTFGGPPAKDLFHLPFVFIETLILLLCSFFSGLGGASAHRKKKNRTIILFGLTFLAGVVFMVMEFHDFNRLIDSGNSWQRSGFLSAYFTLVGTHSLHVILGLLWIIVILLPVFWSGLTPVNIKRLSCLRIFWQFLNVVWVFIFSIVYLMGVN